VLPKPFDLHAILSWVQSVVDLAGEQRENG
jgi:hypothetical protein